MFVRQMISEIEVNVFVNIVAVGHAKTKIKNTVSSYTLNTRVSMAAIRVLRNKLSWSREI